MNKAPNHFYEFSSFRLEPGKRQLTREGERVSLPPKAFDTLLMLIEARGQAIKKDDLIKQVWPNSFVEENNLNQYVSLLRKRLGGDSKSETFIETMPRWGYRFVADVQERWDEETEVALHRNTSTQIVIREEEETTEGSRQKAKTIIAALTRHGLAASVVAIIVMGLGGAFFLAANRTRKAESVTSSKSTIRSIAVLPFRPTSTESGDEYLRLGMADAVITKLGRLKQISVRSTSSIRNYTGNQRDLITIGHELGADAVLDGELEKLGERVRLTARLVRVKDGARLWSEQFEADSTNLFTLQDAIAERVANELAPVLTKEEKEKLLKRYTDNPEAYEAYLQGRFLWNKRTTDEMRKSRDYFQQAIEKDPNFALAYVGLADAYLFDEPYKALELTNKVLQLDDSIGEAHATLGARRMFWGWDWVRAEEEFKRATELSPNYATAHQWYAIYLAIVGRLDEAKREMKQALELDPRSPNMNADMGQICYFGHDYDQAIAYCQKALELDPNFIFAHQYLYFTYAQKGMYAEAVQAGVEALATSDPAKAALLSNAYAAAGWRGFLRAYLQSVEAGPSASSQSAGVAIIYAQLRDNERALKRLEIAYGHGEFFLPFANVDPVYDGLRGDHRFQDLMRQMFLPRETVAAK